MLISVDKGCAFISLPKLAVTSVSVDYPDAPDIKFIASIKCLDSEIRMTFEKCNDPDYWENLNKIFMAIGLKCGAYAGEARDYVQALDRGIVN